MQVYCAGVVMVNVRCRAVPAHVVPSWARKGHDVALHWGTRMQGCVSTQAPWRSFWCTRTVVAHYPRDHLVPAASAGE